MQLVEHLPAHRYSVEFFSYSGIIIGYDGVNIIAINIDIEPAHVRLIIKVLLLCIVIDVLATKCTKTYGLRGNTVYHTSSFEPLQSQRLAERYLP